MRKIHLRDTKFGHPACAGKRSAFRAEHIVMPFVQFVTYQADAQCERCKAGKLFAFLKSRPTA